MKTIHDILAETKLKREELKKHQEMAKTMREAMMPSSHATVESMKMLVHQVLDWMEEQNKRHEHMFDVFLTGITDKMKDMHVTLPEIKLPEIKNPDIKVVLDSSQIKVPRPQVDVRVDAPKIPDIHVPSSQITVTEKEAELPKKISFKRSRFGALEEITEEYTTGKIVSKKTDDGWTIDDKRQKAR